MRPLDEALVSRKSYMRRSLFRIFYVFDLQFVDPQRCLGRRLVTSTVVMSGVHLLEFRAYLGEAIFFVYWYSMRITISNYEYRYRVII